MTSPSSLPPIFTDSPTTRLPLHNPAMPCLTWNLFPARPLDPLLPSPPPRALYTRGRITPGCASHVYPGTLLRVATLILSQLLRLLCPFFTPLFVHSAWAHSSER